MSFTESFFGLFDKLLEQIGVVVDWTATNAVPYVMDLGSRIVWFDTVKHSILAVVLFIVAIISLIVFIRSFKGARNAERYYEADSYEVAAFISAIIGIAAIVLFCFTGAEIVQNILLPEITILEMLQSMIGGVN